jgi:hypothetical protein
VVDESGRSAVLIYQRLALYLEWKRVTLFAQQGSGHELVPEFHYSATYAMVFTGL